VALACPLTPRLPEQAVESAPGPELALDPETLMAPETMMEPVTAMATGKASPVIVNEPASPINRARP
jgi:hypothetical protein